MKSASSRVARLLVVVVSMSWCACNEPRDRSPIPVATPVTGVASSSPLSAEAERGRELFRAHCISCHSVDGRGLQSLGIDLTTSRFVAQQSDAALGEFLRRGRAPDDPGNRTGRQMPGVAVLPEIGDAEVKALVAHLRAINRSV